ncbi:hypothetical protein MRB53_037520 [Persea americana]|nr:hypothetical protein MRB53_037520 [Persea americana]
MNNNRPTHRKTFNTPFGSMEQGHRQRPLDDTVKGIAFRYLVDRAESASTCHAGRREQVADIQDCAVTAANRASPVSAAAMISRVSTVRRHAPTRAETSGVRAQSSRKSSLPTARDEGSYDVTPRSRGPSTISAMSPGNWVAMLESVCRTCRLPSADPDSCKIQGLKNELNVEEKPEDGLSPPEWDVPDLDPPELERTQGFFGQDKALNLMEILETLPPRETVERHVRFYFICHMANPHPTGVPVIWISQLFSIVGIGSGFMAGASTVDREAMFRGATQCLAIGRCYQAQPGVVEALLLHGQCRWTDAADETNECDTCLPRNLTDDDFDEHTLELPPSRPDSHATSMLYYITSLRLLQAKCRAHDCALSLQLKPISEVFEIHAELDAARQSLTLDNRYHGPKQTGISPSRVMNLFKAEVSYQKSLCTLHRRYLGFEPTLREACRNAAEAMLDAYHGLYDSMQPGGRAYRERWVMSAIYSHDYYLAILVLCSIVAIMSVDVSMSEDVMAGLGRTMGMIRKAYGIICRPKVSSPEIGQVKLGIEKLFSRIGEAPEQVVWSRTMAPPRLSISFPGGIPFDAFDMNTLFNDPINVNWDIVSVLDNPASSDSGSSRYSHDSGVTGTDHHMHGLDVRPYADPLATTTVSADPTTSWRFSESHGRHSRAHQADS